MSRHFGERLRELQASRESGRIDQATFQEHAGQIVEDLKDRENELPYWHHHVANSDVGLQYLRFSAQPLGADRPAAAHGFTAAWDPPDLTRGATEAAAAAATTAQAAERHADPPAQGRTGLTRQADRAATEGPRVPTTTRIIAIQSLTEAVRGGAAPDMAFRLAVQEYGINHPLDRDQLHRRAAQLVIPGESRVPVISHAEREVRGAREAAATADQGTWSASQHDALTHVHDRHALPAHVSQSTDVGPRAPFTTRIIAEHAVTDAMRRGSTPEQAVQHATQRHGLTHARDRSDLQQHAAELAARHRRRVSRTVREAARRSIEHAIRNGATAEQAVRRAALRYGITHATDLAALHQSASPRSP